MTQTSVQRMEGKRAVLLSYGPAMHDAQILWEMNGMNVVFSTWMLRFVWPFVNS